MPNLESWLQRTNASICLDILKLKAFVPCKIKDPVTGYECKIVDVVFDPLRFEEVTEQFKKLGFIIRDGHVIALTEDGSILLWRGINSVYHLKKGEEIWNDSDHLAFQSLSDVTELFKIKNKRTEVDAMLAQLKQTYGAEK